MSYSSHDLSKHVRLVQLPLDADRNLGSLSLMVIFGSPQFYDSNERSRSFPHVSALKVVFPGVSIREGDGRLPAVTGQGSERSRRLQLPTGSAIFFTRTWKTDCWL